MTTADQTRKHTKELKRAIARAERIAAEGLTAEDVECPHCGINPRRGFNGRRNPGYCVSPDGRNPLPRHGTHKARHDLAVARKAEIIAAGEAARLELEALGAAAPHPARRFPCLQCGARAGSPCMRPSGHAVPGGDVHAERRNHLEAELDLAARRGATLAPVRPVAQPALF